MTMRSCALLSAGLVLWGCNTSPDAASSFATTRSPLVSPPVPGAPWQLSPALYPGNFATAFASAGDVNGDGFSDVIVGDPACVYAGSATGPAANATWILEGSQGFSIYGGAVAGAGDVNADGYSDLVVGASSHRPDNSSDSNGALFVHLGSANGPEPPTILPSNNRNARLGRAVASGDFNGDGFSDVVGGAPDFTTTDRFGGAAFVYYGSSAGIGPSPSQIITRDVANARFADIVSSAGDVNGDGFSDLVLGTPTELWLYLGSPSGLGDAPSPLPFLKSIASADVNHDGFSDLLGVLPPEQFNYGVSLYLGSSTGLATSPAWTYFVWGTTGTVSGAGDFNGDGFEDVVASSGIGPLLFLGSTSGLSAQFVWAGEAPRSDEFPAGVASAGDVNGDGFADVLAGGVDPWDSRDRSAYVLPGGDMIPIPPPDWSSPIGGRIAAAGDVNRDGYPDIAVSNPDFGSGRGQALVFTGSARGLGSEPVWKVDGQEPNSHLGTSLEGAGDVNGDGYSDLILATANGPSLGIQTRVYQGHAGGLGALPSWNNDRGPGLSAVLSGIGDINGDGFSDAAVGRHVFLGTASSLTTSPSWETAVCDALMAVGDVNGDGFSDVACKATPLRIFRGSASGLEQTPLQIAPNVASSVTTLLSAADVNGDGFSDLLVSAIEGPGSTLALVLVGGPAEIQLTPWWSAPIRTVGYGTIDLAYAGDFDGDGRGDLVVGSGSLDGRFRQEGRAFLHRGSPSGFSASPTWAATARRYGAQTGRDVTAIGDVNGDGRSDIAVQSFGLSADVYYGGTRCFDDTDGDGTPDCGDTCPGTPKSRPGVCGCPTPDVDIDLDGFPNCVDHCPTIPALANHGCPPGAGTGGGGSGGSSGGGGGGGGSTSNGGSSGSTGGAGGLGGAGGVSGSSGVSGSTSVSGSGGRTGHAGDGGNAGGAGRGVAGSDTGGSGADGGVGGEGAGGGESGAAGETGTGGKGAAGEHPGGGTGESGGGGAGPDDGTDVPPEPADCSCRVVGARHGMGGFEALWLALALAALRRSAARRPSPRH
jgi:hypothetical protein